MFTVEIAQRSDWLPPFDEEGLRTVADEITDMLRVIAPHRTTAREELSDDVRLALFFYLQCIERNKRYAYGYESDIDNSTGY